MQKEIKKQLNIKKLFVKYFISLKKGAAIQPQDRLFILSERSASAIDVVTSTIDNLNDINTEISEVVKDISQQQAGLEKTRQGLMQTMSNNQRISEKFRNLIEA